MLDPQALGAATTPTTTWNASSWTSSNGHAPEGLHSDLPWVTQVLCLRMVCVDLLH